MAKRISQAEFAALVTAARTSYIRNIEAASGDAAKVSLAESQRRWAEEDASAALNQKSGIYSFFDSIPLIGKPLAILVDNTEKGIAEHGFILGLLQGGLTGIVLAASLLVITEGAAIGFDLARNWLNYHYINNLKSEQVGAAYQEEADRAGKEYDEKHGANPKLAGADDPYYQAIDRAKKEYEKKNAKPDPAEPVLPTTTPRYPVTLSDTPFIPISREQYSHLWNRNKDVEPQQPDLEALAGQLDAATTLPKGVRYATALRGGAESNNLKDVITITGVDKEGRKHIALPVYLQDGTNRHGLVPFEAFQPYLKMDH